MKKAILSASALIMIFWISSCKLNSNNSTTKPASAFLVAQASPDAPSVDVYVNSSPLASNVMYGDYTTYTPVAPGSYTIRITPYNETAIITDTTFNFLPGIYYSVIAIDSFSKIKPAVIRDSLVPPGADSASIRFFNLSPNSSPVDFGIAGQSALYSSRTFNDELVYNTSFSPIKAGTYNFEVRIPGTSIILTSASQVLLGGRIYTLYFKGFIGGTGTQAPGINVINNY